MNTYIFDFLNKYIQNSGTRLHMPGHKGEICDLSKLDHRFDITEIKGADSLYNPNNIIDYSEQNLSKIYNSKFSVFSTGGSTLSIQTMLYTAFQNKKTKKIIAFRNVHTAFINSCGLLDLNPVWVYPNYDKGDYVSGNFSIKELEQVIKQNLDAGAVYVTSPDYLGFLCDIEKISKICDEYNIPLLVDNAHGAHLNFLSENNHPINLGATMCCDSAHKTLPALTGASFLHIGKGEYTKQQIKDNMQIFGSTSPSYLILSSMDLCLKYIDDNGEKEYKKLEIELSKLKEMCEKKGFAFSNLTQDNVKITLNSFDVGYMGEELAEYFRNFNIEPEYVGESVIVFLFSPFNSQKDFEQFKIAILNLKVNEKIQKIFICPQKAETVLSPRQCLFGDFEVLPIDNCVGKIACENKILCPPGVPIVMAGEIISEVNKNLLKNTGIINLKVVK